MLGYFEKRKAKKVLEKTTKYMMDNPDRALLHPESYLADCNK